MNSEPAIAHYAALFVLELPVRTFPPQKTKRIEFLNHRKSATTNPQPGKILRDPLVLT